MTHATVPAAPRASHRSHPVALVLVVAALLSLAVGAGRVATAQTAPAADQIYAGPIPDSACAPGAVPETSGQGRVSKEDVDSGAAADGFRCNTEQLGHVGSTGGFRVSRYTDGAGRECAYYDSTLLFPKDTGTSATEGGPGVYVLDMTDPANPVRTATLTTPAMLSPHESLRVNQTRGLLAADMGYPTTNPGFVDIYDLSQDCRQPVLKSSTPFGIFGHESGFAPDGNTFYVSGTTGMTLTALDVTDPSLPKILYATAGSTIHGMSVSDDGNRLYAADIGNPGLTIFDTSQIQARTPNPQVPQVSHLTWPEVSIPQNTDPVTIGGKPYLIEIDEYTSSTTRGPLAAESKVGAARIIDLSDESAPRVVSNMRLAVHQDENRAGEQAGDPGANSPVQGYAGHYCSVPTRVEPTIVACSMIVSGLRIFDIRNPEKPVEVGYFNTPVEPGVDFVKAGAFAMSAPAFAPERDEVWYSDGNSGFYSLKLTGAAKAALNNTSPVQTGAAGTAVTGPFALPDAAASPGAAQTPGAAPGGASAGPSAASAAGTPGGTTASQRSGRLPATGLSAGLPWLMLSVLLLGLAALRRRTA